MITFEWPLMLWSLLLLPALVGLYLLILRRKKQAAIIVRMASEGTAHRISAYNADIKRMNAAGRAADKVGAPAIVNDTSWAEKRLASLGTKISDSAGKADELRAKALKELGYTR